MRFPVLLLLVAAPFAAAQSLTVVYLEGKAQASSAAGWSDLSLGEALASDSSIRVADGGLVQLQGPGAAYTLTRPGTYALRDILTAGHALSAAGVAPAVEKFMRLLSAGPTRNQSVALGARGADQSGSDEDQWAESSAQVFLEAGKEYLEAGKYDQAVAQLMQALDSATPGESAEVRYYLADAAFLKGDMVQAWKQASTLQPASTDQWAADFVLFRARLLEATSGYADAVTWLVANDLSRDAQRAPLYFFLLGLGYRGTGDGDGARRALTRVVDMTRDSDLGKTASALLAG